MKTWKPLLYRLLPILAGALLLAIDSARVILTARDDLSVGFDPGGAAIATVDIGGDVSSALALQADGKVVMVEMGGFALARYNPNGSLDTNFGTGGKVTTHISPDEAIGDMAYALAIQVDGKIVVTGISWNGVSNDFALVRYNSDGSLDTSFGKDGKVTTDFPYEGDRPFFRPSYDEAFALAIQKDAKLVAAGLASSDFALVCYNPNGSLDPSFGTGGKIITPIRSTGAHALALQPRRVCW